MDGQLSLTQLIILTQSFHIFIRVSLYHGYSFILTILKPILYFASFFSRAAKGVMNISSLVEFQRVFEPSGYEYKQRRHVEKKTRKFECKG